jgi:hypothetical protein
MFPPMPQPYIYVQEGGRTHTLELVSCCPAMTANHLANVFRSYRHITSLLKDMSFTEQQPLTDTSSNQTGRKNTAHGSNASDLKDMFVFGGSSISSTASKESFPTYADAITQTNTLFTRDDIANRPELNGWLFLRSCDYLLNRFLAAKTMVRAADGSRKLKEPYHVQSLQEAETRCELAQNLQLKYVSALHKYLNLKRCRKEPGDAHLFHLSSTGLDSAIICRGTTAPVWTIIWLKAEELTSWLEEYDLQHAARNKRQHDSVEDASL